MHTLSINFISFTAEMHTYIRQKRWLWHLGGHGPFGSPPKSAYVWNW